MTLLIESFICLKHTPLYEIAQNEKEILHYQNCYSLHQNILRMNMSGIDHRINP